MDELLIYKEIAIIILLLCLGGLLVWIGRKVEKILNKMGGK